MLNIVCNNLSLGSIPNTSLMCLTRLPPPAKSRNKLREEHKFKMKLVTSTEEASTVQSTSSSVTQQAVTGTQSEDENGNMNMERLVLTFKNPIISYYDIPYASN